MTEALSVPMPPVETDWQRLHPLTLALAIAKLGPNSVNMIPALAAIGIAGSWVYVVPALLIFLLVSLVWAWFSWLRFRFAVGADEVVIESGIFARQHRTIPFDRIQDVSIEQGLIARALGIAKVGFETGAGGGNKSDDGKLDAIALDAAQALRTTIRAHRGADAAATPHTAADQSPAPAISSDTEDRLLFSMTPRELLRAGLFNFSLAALAVVGAATQLFDNFLPFDVFEPSDWIDFAAAYGLDSWIINHRWIAAIGSILSLLFIGFATGIVTTFVRNWDFRLTREPRALRRTRGLTTRTDVALPLRRVQAAIIVTGWFRKRFGWHELRLQSLASDGDKEKDHQVVPFAQLDAIDDVLTELAIARAPDDQIWRTSHAIIALGGMIGAVFAGLGSITALWFGQELGWITLLAVPLIVGVALFSVRHHRWADLPDRVAIRRGFWKPRLTLLPHASVQSIDLKTDLIQRRLGLATLVFGVPGGSSLGTHEIPAIPVEQAMDLRTRMLAARGRR